MKTRLIIAAAAMIAAGAHAETKVPAYTVMGNDTTCRIFLYSPGERDGLHVAYLNEDEQWVNVGRLCSSAYGKWGPEKRMYDPYVLKANDGSWRALWSVNDYAPCFAVAYSEDLVTWRPQDFPIVSVNGCNRPIAYAKDDGKFDIYFKSGDKSYFVEGDADFRHFSDAAVSTIDDAAWLRDTATVDGRRFEGNLHDVPKVHLDYIRAYFGALADDARLSAESIAQDGERFKDLKRATATLNIDFGKQKAISNKLMGVFFEDISYAADGGLYAELVQNRDFEYSARDKPEWTPATGWTSNAPIRIDTVRPLSKNNPHYAVMAADTLSNGGWDGIADRGARYDFSFYVRNPDGGKKLFKVALVADDGTVLAEEKVKTQGEGWRRYAVQLNTDPEQRRQADGGAKAVNVRLVLTGQGKREAAVDMISLFPHETFKGHGLRKDLAETIAALQPKFVRFPGGCLTHGDGLDNIYHWNETIGPWQDRKPDSNIWHYHQTRGLGFYEYFQFCEDIGAEPLPVLAAGVPCQNSLKNACGLGGQQGGIAMTDMPAYIDELLALIEWANGDPATNAWARKRAEAGHPEPFGLKYIGIGNEDLISTVFEERYLMICKAIKARYPEIQVCGTVGPFHTPAADYTEGWRIANANKQCIDMVDEHYYESPGWFMHHTDYYDDYDRKGVKVYLGEYAARGKDARENALAEALYLCGLERNADVVVMSSYAPMLCKEGNRNWDPDMIYFDNERVKTTPNYEVQKMFSTHSGDIYIDSRLEIAAGLKHRVAASVVKDSRTGTTWLKMVNVLPVELEVDIPGVGKKTLAPYSYAVSAL